MEKIIVFLGPTLSRDVAEKILPEATYLPPVRCGDILKLLIHPPKIIAIIDGYFESCAAVWHKEILYALSQGVMVVGASSMGALRGAELCEFGMHGVGKIFEDFHHGRLTDDDEVTVMHGPEQSGFQVFSDAMVNIRATIHDAVEKRMLTEESAERLLHLSKKTFFKQRSLLKLIPSETIFKDFSEHIKQYGLIDQKARDAIELLEKIKKNHLIGIKKERHYPLSLPFKKLTDQMFCEPSPQDCEAIPDKITIKLLRLLAYSTKTFERLACSPLETNAHTLTSVMASYAFSGAAIEIEVMVMALSLLLKITATDTQRSLLSTVARHLIAIEQCVNASGLRLNHETKLSFIKQLRTHFSLADDAAQTEWETKNDFTLENLVPVYFILTEILNRSGDFFLMNERELVLRPYFENAHSLAFI